MLKHKHIGKNIEVTDAIASAIETKLNTLNHHIGDADVDVTTTVRVYPHDKTSKVEVHVFDPYQFHAEDTSDDLYASIDRVVEKLDGQFRRQKTQRLARRRK